MDAILEAHNAVDLKEEIDKIENEKNKERIRNRIVCNGEFGGFSLSEFLLILYNFLSGRENPRACIPRDDPLLADLVSALGPKQAGGVYIKTISKEAVDAGAWNITDYDGCEGVEINDSEIELFLLEQKRKEKADKMSLLVDYLRDKLVKDGIIENFSHPLFVEEEGELSEAEAVDINLDVCADFLQNHHLLRNLSEADGDEQIKSALSEIEIAIKGGYIRKENVQKVAREKKESLGAGGWSQEVAKVYQKVMIAFKE